MKKQTIWIWILLLVCIDQTIKIIINTYYFDVKAEIIPSLLAFEPVFNGKYSYINWLLYENFGLNMGFWVHMAIFLIGFIVVFSMYDCLKKTISDQTKILDLAFIFFSAGTICSLIGSVFWEKGTLDYIFLKPLFVFDLKDVYVNCFTFLFLFYAFKNKKQVQNINIQDFIQHGKLAVKNIIGKNND